jgi:hypothetical protein
MRFIASPQQDRRYITQRIKSQLHLIASGAGRFFSYISAGWLTPGSETNSIKQLKNLT